MTEESKPVRCGCGGEAEILSFENLDNSISVYVSCSKCHMSTVSFCGEQAKGNAIEAWNRAMSGVKEINAPMVKVERLNMVTDHNVVYKCTECGQYMHRTAWSNPVKYCSQCGCRLEWQ